MQNGVDGPSQHTMNARKFLDSDTPVALHLGGDIGDESQVSNSPLGVETPPVCCRFPLLNFLHNVVDLCPLQGLVARHFFDSFFNFLETFPDDSKRATEIVEQADWRASCS